MNWIISLTMDEKRLGAKLGGILGPLIVCTIKSSIHQSHCPVVLETTLTAHDRRQLQLHLAQLQASRSALPICELWGRPDTDSKNREVPHFLHEQMDISASSSCYVVQVVGALLPLVARCLWSLLYFGRLSPFFCMVIAISSSSPRNSREPFCVLQNLWERVYLDSLIKLKEIPIDCV
jgi:hypothetical protein